VILSGCDFVETHRMRLFFPLQDRTMSCPYKNIPSFEQDRITRLVGEIRFSNQREAEASHYEKFTRIPNLLKISPSPPSSS